MCRSEPTCTCTCTCIRINATTTLQRERNDLLSCSVVNAVDFCADLLARPEVFGVGADRFRRELRPNRVPPSVLNSAVCKISI